MRLGLLGAVVVVVVVVLLLLVLVMGMVVVNVIGGGGGGVSEHTFEAPCLLQVLRFQVQRPLHAVRARKLVEARAGQRRRAVHQPLDAPGSREDSRAGGHGTMALSEGRSVAFR